MRLSGCCVLHLLQFQALSVQLSFPNPGLSLVSQTGADDVEQLEEENRMCS